MPKQPELSKAKAGDLLHYRLQIGTFTCNTTRRIIRVIKDGKSFIVEGKNNPTVNAKDVLGILTTISLTQ